jgi:hypothetical protein
MGLDWISSWQEGKGGERVQSAIGGEGGVEEGGG